MVAETITQSAVCHITTLVLTPIQSLFQFTSLRSLPSVGPQFSGVGLLFRVFRKKKYVRYHLYCVLYGRLIMFLLQFQSLICIITWAEKDSETIGKQSMGWEYKISLKVVWIN